MMSFNSPQKIFLLNILSKTEDRERKGDVTKPQVNNWKEIE